MVYGPKIRVYSQEKLLIPKRGHSHVHDWFGQVDSGERVLVAIFNPANTRKRLSLELLVLKFLVQIAIALHVGEGGHIGPARSRTAINRSVNSMIISTMGLTKDIRGFRLVLLQVKQ